MARKKIIGLSVISVLAVTVGLSAVGTPVPVKAGNVTNVANLKSDVIYQVFVDRFSDGDTTNNNPASSPNLYDSSKANWKYYWGGDLAGLTQRMSYLKGMNLGGLWTSPLVQNITQPAVYSNGTDYETGYHGYWARDFYNLEPHFGTWTDFTNFTTAAHQNGIKVIMDFAPNHSNPSTTGEMGNLYKNGTLWGTYSNDTSNLWHHNGGISDWNDRYQVEYNNLADLADLNQESSATDSYLKGAAQMWLNKGVDDFRLDAVKHMPGGTGGWLKTFADSVHSVKPAAMFGEWYLGGGNTDPLYQDNVRFANSSGISVLDFYFNQAARDVFGSNNNMSELDTMLTNTANDYKYKENLVTFLDNHDMSRFLTLNPSYDRLHEALGFLLTQRGTPVIYYGTEQYLHNDNGGGTDPYNRPMMPGFSTTTTAYNEIGKLASLRTQNPAIQYGSSTQRWINNDVYIYERQFYNNVVLVAINKNDTTGYNITGLNTNLPGGTYSDYLGGLLGGNSISVSSGSGNNPVSAFTLQPKEVSVWSYVAPEPGVPQVGSAAPTMVRSGQTMWVNGEGFGSTTGTVKIGGVAATVNSWSSHEIQVTVPSGVTPGSAGVNVTTGGGTSNTYSVEMLTGAQVPVTFTVNNATPTNTGDYIYLSGSVEELGNWGTSKTVAIGPLLCPNYPNWFLNVSVPANTTIQFKFMKIAADGTVTWENGSNHVYTTPSSGTGYVNVNWQY
ncbi:MAG: alpha-amylase family glycosyl hydrolase [Mycobacterium leprae]